MTKIALSFKNQFLWIITFGISFLLINCNGNDNPEPEPCTPADFFVLGCPDTSSNITWNSFGNWQFKLCGDDEFAKQLITKCSWKIYDGHEGGEGEVLEIAADTNNSIVFCWADNVFRAFLVKNGWKGGTDKGIKIESSLEEFIEAYPDFVKLNNNIWIRNNEDEPVMVKFSSDSLLQEILVGSYFEY